MLGLLVLQVFRGHVVDWDTCESAEREAFMRASSARSRRQPASSLAAGQPTVRRRVVLALMLPLGAPLLAAAAAATPDARVAAFIHDYHQWNQRWLERTGLGRAGPAPSTDGSDDEIEAEYEEPIRRHFAAGMH